MRMSKYIKSEKIEDAFFTLHNIRPQVFRQVISHNCINNKLVYKGKEYIINEVLERGLTKGAILSHNGVDRSFTTVYEAELEDVNMMRE